jgi:hypothetical protein
MDNVLKLLVGTASVAIIAGIGYYFYNQMPPAKADATIVTEAQCAEHDGYRNQRDNGGNTTKLPNQILTDAILRTCERQGIKLSKPAPQALAK